MNIFLSLYIHIFYNKQATLYKYTSAEEYTGQSKRT